MWTFHKIKEFILSSHQETWQSEDKLVILVQIPPCYSRTNEKIIASCLKVIDDGIKNTVTVMDDFWSNDGKTSFIFTSAYSSSNENPLVLWGSGINSGGKKIECHHMDLAPLVSALLGLDFPAQNQGHVPDHLLNMSHNAIINAKIANGLQMHEQVVRYQDFFQSPMTSAAYQGLDIQSVLSIVGRIAQLQKSFAFQVMI